MQPTGIIHLGNYFGALHSWLELQKTHQSFFPIVDLHALTIFQDPKELNHRIFDLAKLYIASGLDPKKAVIFRQSDISEHTELAWILTCLAPMGELNRMTQFKDKSAQHAENINAGLFTYPCLMASDILLYDADIVPVGEDQVQHVELTRMLAKKFNNLYGDILKVPELFLNKTSARLKGLDDPNKKMSKSASSEYNYIALTDSPDLIRKKIKRAVTDSGTEIKGGEDKPALANLLTIYSLVTGLTIPEIEQQFTGQGYGVFKNELAERVVAFVEPIQKKLQNISDKEIKNILKNGAEKASQTASKKIKKIKKAIGL